MLEVADALTEVLSQSRPRKVVGEEISPAALGMLLAEDIHADADAPPFDKSLRDGYAVRAADCDARNPELRYLKPVAEIAAGAMPTIIIRPGECARIFTGAPIPQGADAVVMQEDTETLADGRVWVKDANVKAGQWVFARGTEMRAGDAVLSARTALNPAALGVLAGLGQTMANLFPVPRVAILSTGNELVEPGEPLKPGQIRNSNGLMLTAQVLQAGGIAHYRGIVRDDAADTREMIAEAIADSDVVLIAGGVSVGKFDLVPAVLEELGVAIRFRQVRMKPGKPLLFGTLGETLIFGLPGNPVSAFVCCELFVRPAIRNLAGHVNPGVVTTTLPLAEPIAEVNDRPTYRPAKRAVGETGWNVRPLPWAGAPDLRGLQPADALIVLPAGEARFDRGTPVPVVLLD